MTTSPAADCGVSGGCGACPLGKAGVCGDPGTELPGMWERADFTGGLDEVRGPAPDAGCYTLPDGSCVSDKPCMHCGPRVRTPDEWCQLQGLVVLDPDGWADKPWTEPMTRAEFLRRALASTTARVPQRGTEPNDQADRDPAEPRPTDAGCCGGGCG